jgi:hypothetical protein
MNYTLKKDSTLVEFMYNNAINNEGMFCERFYFFSGFTGLKIVG